MKVIEQDGECTLDTAEVGSMDVGIGCKIRFFGPDDQNCKGMYWTMGIYESYDIANVVYTDIRRKMSETMGKDYTYQMPQGNEQWIADRVDDRLNGWVSVRDHLPEPGTEVIVTAELKSGQRVVRAATYTEFGFSGNGNMNNVKAWIKMPEAYKGDLAWTNG